MTSPSSTFTFKTIKTPRMNIQPTRKLIQNAVQAEAKFQKRKLEKTVSAWKRKPKFVQEVVSHDPDLIVTVGPEDTKAGLIWFFLDKGTRKNYPIVAKNKPFLVFRQNYSPGTQVGKFSSSPSGSYGDWRRKRQVTHPGIEARGWTDIISEERQRPFRDRILKAVKKGADKIYP